MGEAPTILALYLDAPMQSWGYQSKFDRRTTLPQPTRSALIGMFCAAMGIERDNSQALMQFVQLKMTCLTFLPGGKMIDFHTVGGGWAADQNPQNIVPTAQAKVSSTVVTHREYLEGAKFGILVTGAHIQLEAISKALLNPCWGIWLGRKACIPTTPICQGMFEDREAAITHLTTITQMHPQRITEEVDLFEEGCIIIYDIPLNFAQRRFAPRIVRL